ncbi:MAG: HlyD family efflux transporter periplasmic adaptor subunit [Planctomycetaceae bacterium]|nr:HlyD family efflux transporter periplasmic adaptor subunit [Planctomycetaceae bacterium]
MSGRILPAVPVCVLSIGVRLTASLLIVLACARVPGEEGRNSGNAVSKSDRLTVQDCLTRFPHRRRLASERSGILVQAPEEGERFESGAIVARLSDAVPRATLAVAAKKASTDVDVRRAEKAYELARLNYEKMVAANSARPGTFDPEELKPRELEASERELQVDVARHEFEVAQLEVEQHRAELGTYEIRTERGGMVTNVVKHDGEGVQLGEEVLEIVDTNVIRVEGHADGRYLGRLRPGLPVTVRVSLPAPDRQPSRTIDVTGTLGFVDISLTSGDEVRVWADVENSTGTIAEGMHCVMEIELTE